VFVVDRGGRVVFRKTYSDDRFAPVDEILTVLEKI
jgi:hypothetical protein